MYIYQILFILFDTEPTFMMQRAIRVVQNSELKDCFPFSSDLKETDHPTHEVEVEFQLKYQELEFTKWKFNIMAFGEIKCFFSPSK